MTTKRAVIYARVSSDDRGKDGRNLDSQIEMGRKYALEHDYRIVAELPEDDRGASGASFELPQLNGILSMADCGTFDVLVIREIDRLSHLAKQLIVEEMLKRAGVEIEYILGDYPDTSEGRLQKHIRATIAEFEREKINERMTRGRLYIVRRGEVMFHGDKPPYGYRLSDDSKALIVYEPEATIVRMMFEWYTSGDENGKRLAVKSIADRLSEMRILTWRDVRGFKKQRESGQWYKATVSSMLHNETYTGVWRYGKRRDHGTKATKKALFAVQVPAIISAEVWQAAQKQFKTNQVKQKHEKKRSVSDDFTLDLSMWLFDHGLYHVPQGARIPLLLLQQCPP
jgi:site-specific DNA recombinase